MKKVKLTHNQVAIVDDEDYLYLCNFKWLAAWSPISNCYYAKRGYRRDNGKWSTLPMHRLIMGLKHGDKKHVDHINHDTLDNRKCNLRICTHSENQRNNRGNTKNKTGVRGVSLSTSCPDKYHAQIVVNNKTIYLGTFSDIREATRVRKDAETRYFGEFAPNSNDKSYQSRKPAQTSDSS